MFRSLTLAAALSLATLTGALAQAASGKVVRVDAANGRVTIDHGPIKKLDMGAMQMAFRARDPAMLKGLKEGDRVQFDVELINGSYTLTKLSKAK